MTEDEAKTKWCPMARVSASDHPAEGVHARNRDSDGYPCRGSKCFASKCMWWVWDGGKLSPNGLHDSRTGHCGAIR